MKAGKLRHIIDWEQPGEVRGVSGSVTLAPWSTFAENVRCRISPAGGDEALLAAEFISRRTHTITQRYLPGLTTKMRGNYKTDAQRLAGQDGRLFDILEIVDVDEMHRQHRIHVQESTRGKGI